jgi:AbrB family looped-hinge helix DNA binding protein
MADVLVGKRAQVVIPAQVRKQLGIEEGDRLNLEVDELGRIVMERVDPDPIERLRRAGAASHAQLDAVEHQRALRDESDR